MSVTQSIGIDREIKLEWLDAAAYKAATETDVVRIRTYLNELLQPECRSKETRKKVVRSLIRIWANVPEEHRSIQKQALHFLLEEASDTRLWLHWGMTLMAYPFVRDIADIIGRLLALQGEVSFGQIYRRLSEKWGQRSTVQRASNRVVRSMVAWGVLQDTNVKGVYVAAPARKTVSTVVQLWLLEALLRAEPGRVATLEQLLQLPTTFPFQIDLSPADIRRSKRFDVQRQGLDLDLVVVASR